MMAIPALTFACVIVDNQGMLIIQVQCKHTKPRSSRESPHLYIKGIATSVENCYSTHVLEMCEASVAICKTKSALYRHSHMYHSLLFVWMASVSCYILLVDSIIVSTLVTTHLGIADLPPGTSQT